VTGLLADKVVVVAGLGGIGNGLARRYADEGAMLVIGDLDGALATRVASDLDPSGERVLGVPLDGADENSVASIVSRTVEKFGRLNGIHVNFTSAASVPASVSTNKPPPANTVPTPNGTTG
jgi:NAD(P)-dependent dehydrogenase (short-subunit alcohol dehydrogenase family)